MAIVASTLVNTNTDLNILNGFDYIFVNARLAPVTITLPNITADGINLYIHRIDLNIQNPVTVVGTNGQLINGKTEFILLGRSKIKPVAIDGNWQVALDEISPIQSLGISLTSVLASEFQYKLNTSQYITDWSTVSDNNDNFSNGIYTAPVNGIYEINLNLHYEIHGCDPILLKDIGCAPRFEIIVDSTTLLVSGKLHASFTNTGLALNVSSNLNLYALTKLTTGQTLTLRYSHNGISEGNHLYLAGKGSTSTWSSRRVG